MSVEKISCVRIKKGSNQILEPERGKEKGCDTQNWKTTGQVLRDRYYIEDCSNVSPSFTGTFGCEKILPNGETHKWIFFGKFRKTIRKSRCKSENHAEWLLSQNAQAKKIIGVKF